MTRRLIFPAALLAGVAAAPAVALDFEAETFDASHDVWGLPIRVATCDVASGGQVADGLDVPGEWIEVPATLDAGGAFETWIACQGVLDAVNSVRLTARDAGTGAVVATVDYVVVGEGIG